MADSYPKDAHMQARYLRSLNEGEQPQEVIRRVKSRQYAENDDVLREYNQALMRISGIKVDPTSYNSRNSYSPPKSSNSNFPQQMSYSSQPSQSLNFNPELGTAKSPIWVTKGEDKDYYKKTFFRAILSFGTTFLVFYLIYNYVIAPAMGVKKGSSGGGGNPLSLLGGDKEYVPELQTNKSFKDVKGIDEYLEEITDIVEFLKHPEKFNNLGGRMPRGVLLVGSPGTGKTLMAKAIAGEANVPFFFAAGSEFDEVLVGMGAKRIRALFEAARKHAPCIVFIDEIDAVGGKRSVRDSNYARQSLNQLLNEMDGFRTNEAIIVIGATNLVSSLDSALLRPGRFDKQIEVPLPNLSGRKEILQMYLAKTIHEKIDLDKYASKTTGMSGADLENFVNVAAIHAAKLNKKEIQVEDFEYSYDRLALGIENKSLHKLLSEKDKYATAVHELGHAIMGLERNEKKLHKVTIVPRGGTLGVTHTTPNDSVSMTKTDLINMIDTLLGGTVAEEVFFGKEFVSTGASNDIQRITSTARKIITQFGMSRLGHLDLSQEQQNGDVRVSDETSREIDMEMRKLVNERYEIVKDMITQKKREIEKIAKLLVKYETLSGQEINDLLEGKNIRTEAERIKY